MGTTIIDPADYLTDEQITTRWPSFRLKELRKARRLKLLGYFKFRQGPRSTPTQLLDYLDAKDRNLLPATPTARTKASIVYFVRAGERVKIGTTCDLKLRMRGIRTISSFLISRRLRIFLVRTFRTAEGEAILSPGRGRYAGRVDPVARGP